MREVRVALIAVVLACLSPVLRGQTLEQATFDEAVRRAILNHPTVQRAAADILRAEAVVQQARAQSLPSIGAGVATNVIDPVTRFSGSAISPRTQAVTTADVVVPLIVPVRWAERNQAEDQVLVSQRAADDARRQIGVATGEAYLSVIALQQVLELNERARDNARAHYDYANQRFQGGIGSRLNAVRAEQEVSANESRVEEARLAVRRAQEALGVLVAADGPVNVAGEPTLDLPPATVSDADLIADRDDLRLIQTRESAAQRRAADAWKDYLPSVTALFAPQVLSPTGLFANSRSWRASLLFTVPLFDSGERRGQTRERLAFVDVVRAERAEAERQASSEVRIAREAVAAFERALMHAQRAAEQANEVVRITDIAFREGATTNIEVIDAQRQARDAETAVAIAAHAVRRARLELLVATGRFPQ
ncbi:MAG TPA: TolC family protein [Vicinamibacterales bacterium]